MEKIFPFWEPTFAPEKFLQNFLSGTNIKLFEFTHVLSIVVLNVKNGTNNGIRIREYVSCIVALISEVKNRAKVSFSISK